MKFDHLIQINDPQNPLIPPLSRHQVWLGLLHRVEDPLPFRIRRVVELEPAHPGGSLTITIEEPEPASLFLRFAYRSTLASGSDSEDRAYIEYVKSAYHQSDVDCVRLIRTLAAAGMPQ